VAPLAAVMVLVLVVGMARLTFTGTLHFSTGTTAVAAGAPGSGELAGIGGLAPASTTSGTSGAFGTQRTSAASGTGAGVKRRYHGAVLVVGGFGSNCCNSANGLRAAEPGMLVRQFSYLGLNAAGQPIAYGPDSGDLPIQVLGDRMATQVNRLYQQAHVPVDIVAESEGTLGLYAMLARHPHVRIGSLVPLADAVTLPACSWPKNMIFVDALHGGLLGDALVRQMVEAFLANGALGQDSQSEQDLRRAAALIAAAASAWRMPDLHPACQA
jgi:hypothetical protein